MKISEHFKFNSPVMSFELFPPRRDEDVEPLFQVVEELKALKPAYISITYGAGGSTQDRTFEIAERLLKAGVEPLVHFTCVGHGRDSIAAQLDKLKQIGVQNILALRGDPPKGSDKFEKPKDGFGYANELVSFIKSRWDFCVAVAAYPETHPEARNANHDLEMLKQKVDAGADFINTQLFFDNQAYFSFIEKAKTAGIKLPIVPGVMPVQSGKFFSRDWGASIPADFKAGFDIEDEEAAKTHGLNWAIKQCKELLQGGAPGLHVYAMNKSAVAAAIHQAL